MSRVKRVVQRIMDPFLACNGGYVLVPASQTSEGDIEMMSEGTLTVPLPETK